MLTWRMDNVLTTNEMHYSYHFFIPRYLLYMFRKNLVFHHQEHCIMYCITPYIRYNRAGEARLACTILPKLCDTVHYTVLLTMNE